MKRLFDLIFCIFLLVLFAVPILLIIILIHTTSKGETLYWSDRVGKNNIIYKMPKFRSMKVNSPIIATNLISNVEQHFSQIGSFLRRYSLDELPQFFSILKDDMSFVGPRPALFNQYDLIDARTKTGVDKLLPGITGWAQVNGRDELSIHEKASLDEEYLIRQSFWFDMKILWMTLNKVLKSEGINH